jgi:hypothetical protein
VVNVEPKLPTKNCEDAYDKNISCVRMIGDK